MLRIIVVTVALCFFSSVTALALDASVDFSFSQSTMKTVLLNPSNWSPYLSSYKSSQINNAVLLSQSIGENFSIGGRASVANQFTTNASNKIILSPLETDYQISATYSLLDMFIFSMEYNLYCSTYFDNETALSITFDAPLNLDWFSLAATLSAAYEFSVYYRGFGGSFSVFPQFSITDWSLSIGMPASLNFAFPEYKGASEAGFESVSTSLSIDWTIADTVTLSGSLGYSFSLSSNLTNRFFGNYPFFQLSVGFLISSEKYEPEEEDGELTDMVSDTNIEQ